MENITVLIESILYFFCLFVISKNIYGNSVKNKGYLFIICITYLTIALLCVVIDNTYYKVLFAISVILNVIMLKLIFKDYKLYSIASSYLILYSISSIFSFVGVFLTDQTANTVITRLTGFSLNAIVLIILVIVVSHKKDTLQDSFSMIPLSVKRIALASILASTFLIGIILDYGTSIAIAEWSAAQKITTVFLIAIIGSVFPVLVANSIGKSFYSKQAKLFEEQIEAQAQHYEQAAKRNFELRRFKHDYQNLLIGVEQLIKDGDTVGALQWLEQQRQTRSGADAHTFDTGNGIVDAILTEKQRRAQAANSTITFEGNVPTEKISPTDLCIIFGCTLDNAIEACEQLDQGMPNTIVVVCRSSESFVFVNISNPVKQKADIVNGTVQTTKQDQNNHGFGLYSLKKAIEKYDGNVHFDCNENQFSVDLELTVPA